MSVPPRALALALAMLLPGWQRDAVLGDLDEMFEVRTRRDGRLRATLWYAAQVLAVPLWIWTEEGTTMLAQTLREARFAWRGFLRTPAFTATTVLTLAVGMGAVTAVFTVVNGVLMEPLGFAGSDRLVDIQYTGPGIGLDRFPSSVGSYLLSRESSRTLESVGLYSTERANLTGGESPRRVAVARVTPGLLQTLRLEPVLGRGFTEAEGEPGADPVALLSHAEWTDAHGADGEVLGRTLHVDGAAREIVGVLPPDLDYPFRETRVWVPLRVDPAATEFGGFNHNSIGRLAPAMRPGDVAAEMAGQLPVLADRFEGLDMAMLETARIAPVVAPLTDRIVGRVRPALWILSGTVGFVLLIACGNVANLLLVRAEGRQKETAIRVALGADRTSLLGRAMAESGFLALAAGALGVMMAAGATALLRRSAPAALPRLEQVGFDLSVLAVAGSMSTVVAVAFGVLPLFRRRADALALRDGGRGATGGRGRHRTRQALVAGQVALALVLLAGSGLMVRSFRALLTMDPGFRSDHVVVFDLALPRRQYPDGEAQAALYHRLLDRLEVLPGVEAAGFASRVPLTGLHGVNPVATRDTPTDDPSHLPPVVALRTASPGFFRVLGIPVLEGRSLNRSDATGRTGVVLVSARAAATYWPERSAVGQDLRSLGMGEDDWSTVAGVVGDVPYLSLTEPPMGAVYFPVLQPDGHVRLEWLAQSVTVVLKTPLPPSALAGPIRTTVRELDPTLPIANLTTMDAILEGARAQMAFTMVMLALAAGIGLLLGIVGLYGVVSYVTGQRTREIGVRIALGAAGSSVRTMVLRQGLRMVMVGAVAGVAASLFLTRLMQTVLYEVRSTDPITLLGVTALLLAVSGLAIWIPARRAAATDPMEALRMD